MADLPPYDERTLLDEIAKGDEKAFRKIYDQYQKKIFSFAWLLTESKDLSEEVVQEAFIKLWSHREKLGNVEYFSAYLHTIVRNLVTDAMKKVAKETLVKKELINTLTADGNYADDIIFSRENERILQKAIEQLTPQQQVIYKLSKQDGLKNEEIATRLNISMMTVKNHLVNAMRTIREYFRQHSSLIMITAFAGSLVS